MRKHKKNKLKNPIINLNPNLRILVNPYRFYIYRYKQKKPTVCLKNETKRTRRNPLSDYQQKHLKIEDPEENRHQKLLNFDAVKTESRDFDEELGTFLFVMDDGWVEVLGFLAA